MIDHYHKLCICMYVVKPQRKMTLYVLEIDFVMRTCVDRVSEIHPQ